MHYLGNKDILNIYKIGFLCSRKVPANIILKTYDWAIEQRDKGVCIVSGFHSKIEKDVFEILIKGTQPIITVLARGLKQRWDKKLVKLVEEQRLLIISPFSRSINRITKETAMNRNQIIAEISDKLFIPFAQESGNIDEIQKMYRDKITTLV